MGKPRPHIRPLELHESLVRLKKHNGRPSSCRCFVDCFHNGLETTAFVFFDDNATASSVKSEGTRWVNRRNLCQNFHAKATNNRLLLCAKIFQGTRHSKNSLWSNVSIGKLSTGHPKAKPRSKIFRSYSLQCAFLKLIKVRESCAIAICKLPVHRISQSVTNSTICSVHFIRWFSEPNNVCTHSTHFCFDNELPITEFVHHVLVFTPRLHCSEFGFVTLMAPNLS
mmetsp:Transcript_28574/g.66415  ORF Transcript_28574/g.66415 Transcript_28574/m.66415 type:complete len:225 (-) Transcript_28574:155-829(-)